MTYSSKGVRARHLARALIVCFVVMALLTSLPMSAPEAQGARVVDTFDDGADTKTLVFTSATAGTHQTLFVKVRADVTVHSANLSASGLGLLKTDTVFGPSWTGYRCDLSGDVDNDGYNDYVISNPVNDNNMAGLIYVLRGSTNGTITPQNVTLSGTATGDRLGWGMSSGGDINNDGYDDVVAGVIEIDANGVAQGSGSADIFWGGTSPMNTTAQVTIRAGANGDVFGFDLSSHGDVNDDGYDDIIVGAPDNLDFNGPGAAYLFLGGASGPGTSPDVTLDGKTNGDTFGNSVHIAGDVNGDGYDDVLVGAPSFNGTAAADWDLGKVHLYFGNANGVNTTPDWTYTGDNADDNLGFHVSGVGDVNGDGYDDLIAGAAFYDGTATDAGALYFFYGGKKGPGSSADMIYKSTTQDGFLGWDCSGIGDVNNDGYGDFAVGEPQTSNGSVDGAGTVHVFVGSSDGVSSRPLVSIKGSTGNGFVGAALGPGGDVNGDGYDDMAHSTRYARRAFVNYGEDGVDDPVVKLDDTPIWSHAGGLLGERVTSDFADTLNAYIAAHQAEQDTQGYITVPFNVTTSAAGRIRIDMLDIVVYKLLQPTNLQAQALPQGSSVKLTWDAHDIKGDDISRMSIEMWNGTAWEQVHLAPKNAKRYTVTNLTDGVQYRFRLRAHDSDIDRYSPPSEEVAVTPEDTLPPEMVRGVKVREDRDAWGLNVSWFEGDPDVLDYEVWTNRSGAWEVLANVSTPQTWFIDLEVDDGPLYYYRVRAWDEVPLVGEFSPIAKGRLEDVDPPQVPSGLQVSIVEAGRALDLSWDLNDDDTVVYSIESNKSGMWREIALVGKNVSSYRHRGLEDGVRYYYRLAARDESGNPSNYTAVASQVSTDLQPPSAPQNLQATSKPVGNMVRLTWDLNTDDTVRYDVYIYNTTGSRWDLVRGVFQGIDQYEIADLENGVTYRLRVRAVDAAGHESEWSEEVTATPVDTMPPTIPSGLKGTLDPAGGAVNLSWEPNTDDAVRYRVLVWDETDWLEVDAVDHPTDWYYVDGLTNNQPYAFVVRAIDEADNESPNSKRVDVIPKDTIPPQKPVFVDVPTITNQKDLTVDGVCEPGAEISLFVNNVPEDETVTCDEDGRFSISIRLKSGPNELQAEAADGSGETTLSDRHTVQVDVRGPKVDRTDPVSGTSDIALANFTFEVFFSEEVQGTSIKCFLRKDQHELSSLVQMIGDGENIVPRLKEYDRVRSVATFEVEVELDGSTEYSILVHGANDLAGNPMDHDHNAFALYVKTRQAPGGGGGTTEDGGLGNLVWIAVAIIIIVLVIVVAVLVISRTGTHEEVEVDRSEMAAPVRETPTTAGEPEPDVKDLYREAYDERGEANGEHHEVGGLADWLHEQEESHRDAEAEAERLKEEIRSQEAEAAPGTAEEGDIEEVPPGMLPEDERTPGYHEDVPEAEEGEADEVEPEAGKEGEADEVEPEAEEEAEEEADEDAAALLDELEEDLESDEEKKD